MRPTLAMLVLGAAAACGSPDTGDGDTDDTDTVPTRARFATFNASMFRGAPGDLASDMADPGHEPARVLAAILQEVRPDVLLLEEFDWDADALALERFLAGFAEVSQDGREPVSFEHRFVPTVNTGVPSGHDLDNSGTVVSTPGSDAYGNDCFGFGEYPGQYGLLVLSRFPIDAGAVRTFQEFRWADVPGALLPDDPGTPTASDWYSTAELADLRLSSKTHADVPIDVGGHVVHFLVSHPTPPTFDGTEDRNGRRNHDEIRFWVDYLDGGPSSWHIDDAGLRGALSDESFVIAGDLNNDPNDGGGLGEVVTALLDHTRVSTAAAPRSEGGVEQATAQGGRNAQHTGDPAEDTADFNDNSVGNLRIDFVLPSSDLPVVGSGVFWPASDDPDFALVGTFPFPLTDHRLVWVDVDVP